MEGWIKLHRKIVENPYYFSEPFTRSQAWIDLIILANHKEGFFFKRGIKVIVKVGEVGYDLDTLGKRWKWSRGKVERFIKELEIDNQVIRQKTNVTTLISIVNYVSYQTDSKAKDKPSSKADGHQIVKQTEANKNDKNEDNDNNKYDFVNPDFLDIFKRWMSYKKDRRESYKSIDSEKTFYNSLFKMSDGKIDIAKKIVEKSITNNWAGIFELKESDKNGTVSDIFNPNRMHR